jgi:hypothetical protein
MQLPSRKLHPFKLLCVVLWGQHGTSVIWTGTRCRVYHGPLARLLGVSNHKLRCYVEELGRMGYVVDLETEWGSSAFRVAPPPSGRIAA